MCVQFWCRAGRSGLSQVVVPVSFGALARHLSANQHQTTQASQSVRQSDSRQSGQVRHYDDDAYDLATYACMSGAGRRKVR